MASDTPLKTYKGNCHCGALRFELEAPEITEGNVCNCSLCVKKGYIWMFAPSKEAFKVLSGEDKLHEYRFGQKVLVHKVSHPTEVECFDLVFGQYGVERC